MKMLTSEKTKIEKAQLHVRQAIMLLAEHRQDAPLDTNFKIFDEILKMGTQLCKIENFLGAYSEVYYGYFSDEIDNPVSSYKKATKNIRKKDVAANLFLRHVANARVGKKARRNKRIADELRNV